MVPLPHSHNLASGQGQNVGGNVPSTESHGSMNSGKPDKVNTQPVIGETGTTETSPNPNEITVENNNNNVSTEASSGTVDKPKENEVKPINIALNGGVLNTRVNDMLEP